MGEGGELNLGQLVREQHGAAAALLGFSTHHGTVTAASDWGDLFETKQVRPALSGSCEDLLHRAGGERCRVILRGHRELQQAFAAPRLQRAIGVIYRPKSERQSHYCRARLARQFDAIVHIDETHALQPLDPSSDAPAAPKAPATYPSAV